MSFQTRNTFVRLPNTNYGFYVRTLAPASAAPHTHALWYSYECASTDKKLLNEVFIFVFFAHKKYYCGFITLWLNHWCHMDYFNDVLATFLGLEIGSCIAVYAGSESSRISSWISLYLCSEDEWRSYGTKWGWVINDRIFIFKLTIPILR